MNHISFHNDTVGINGLWYNSHKTLIEKIAIELDVIDRIDELSKKFLGEKQKLKKMADPSKPKRPKSSYLHFCEYHREGVKNDNPGIKIGDLMKKLGEKWRNASDEDKRKFNDLHQEGKDKYEDEIEIYNKNS